MTRLIELGGSAIRGVLERVGRGLGRYQERRPLEHDLLESDEEYLVVFDAPGVEKGDVQVRFIDDTVEVRLERFRPFYEGFDMRFPGRGLTLTGTATLPEDANVTPAGATATLTDSGTLKVWIRKDPRVRSVDVEEEAEVDAETKSEIETEMESETDAEADAKTNVEIESGTDAETEYDDDAETEYDDDAETEYDDETIDDRTD